MDKRRMFFVLGIVVAVVMFGSVSFSAPISGQVSSTGTNQYDTYIPDWVYMTWGQLPGPVTATVGNHTITATGTGTATDPYRFEVSPEITITPSGTAPNFSSSNPFQNLIEFGNWVERILQPQTQPQPQGQVPEPSILAMLLVGLVVVSSYRSRSN